MASPCRGRRRVQSLLGLEHGANLSLQGRNAIADDVPDQLEVNAEVVMNEAIAHAGHGAPLDRRVGRAKVVRHLLGSFANDFDAANKSTPKRLVLDEGLEREAFDRSAK